MSRMHDYSLSTALKSTIGMRRFGLLERVGAIPGSFFVQRPIEVPVPRADVSHALAIGLMADLMDRVPLAYAYVAERALLQQEFVFDHGAMRTVKAPSGHLPVGREAIRRILGPLGYEEVEVYPLDRLGMKGYVFRHIDLPEEIPQYFVSELEPERFSPDFQAIVNDIVETSVDPLSPEDLKKLETMTGSAAIPFEEFETLLPSLIRAFGRHHRVPSLEEYERLLTESAEMAWISTEGHTFNHITDRVSDVEAVAERERKVGRPVKDVLEVSRTGRVRQTAFQAAQVERIFRSGDGIVTKIVPGSFLEFISRDALEDGKLDLAFDASNAQGIFKMTSKED